VLIYLVIYLKYVRQSAKASYMSEGGEQLHCLRNTITRVPGLLRNARFSR